MHWTLNLMAGYLGAEHPMVGALLTLWALSIPGLYRQTDEEPDDA